MKKIILAATAAAICLAALPLTACSGKNNRTIYQITAQYSQSDATLAAVAEVDYYNGGADTDCVEFNLYGNAYRQGALYKPVSTEFENSAYYDGKSYGEMKVSAVEGAESWEVCGEDENILKVSLGSTLKSGARRKISIEYTLQLAKVNHRTGVTKNTVNLGNFYPQACVRTDDGGFYECVYYSDGDPFYSDCADYMVELTLPEGYDAAASGTKKEQGGNTAVYELENARDFCLVLSDSFKVISREAGDTQISYYYVNDDSAQKKLDAAAESFEYFEDTFGEYCYPSFSVVQTGFAAGGMEYPALAMINGELNEANGIYATVHETAHQWWYAMVGSNQIENAWQDEGLAEYSALCFFENNPAYGFTRTGLVNSAKEAYRAYYSVYNQIFGDADTSMNRHLKDFVSDYEYVNIAYNKGLIMFDTLRDSIGDERFFAALKKYFSASCGKNVSPDALIESFTSTGVDLDGFFESFTEGKIII
ncbi:MAG TPA: M1 family metallopeptidase [Candidatus Coproplasma excrementavium]|nr:M1 family metallopeptidase [Candidatus Coproplasma excrementavium]